MTDLFQLEPYNFYLLSAGFIALLAATIPNIFQKKHLTPPIFYLVIGIVFALAGHDFSNFDIVENAELIRHLSEFVVIVALTNAGLKIKKPFDWTSWKYSFRLLIITMPLTIIGAAYVSWWFLGLAPATAVLFGALISPTDPVLASDLQTSRPSKKDLSKIRLALTSEAGMNDGLAFPFTFLAIMLATYGGNYQEWLAHWFGVDVFYKIIVGVLTGLLLGAALYKLIFQVTSENHHSKVSRGILSLALTLVPYGLTELLGGYGFISVFVAACAFSNSEDKAKHMDSLHDFTEEVERIFVALLFVFVGIYICDNVSMLWDYRIIGTALILLFVIRPLSGWIAFYKSDLNGFEKFVLSFYGIRGIGSIFYLTYAFGKASFTHADKLIQVTVVTILLSVIIHGLTATTIQKRLGA